MAAATLSLQIPGGPDAAHAARRVVCDAVEDALDPKAAADLRLLVSELVTNSVIHGHVTDGERLRLEVEMTADAVRVSVIDDGPGFAASFDNGGDAYAIGHWGLLLVERLSNRWGASVNSHTRVWFELSLRAGGS
jgi:anti-sigma regulatory factor (Ser/Thr protein kinase)